MKEFQKIKKYEITRLVIYSSKLEDGTLVGLNENPSHGWLFPAGKWKTNAK